MKSRAVILLIIALLASLFYIQLPIGQFSDIIFDIGMVGVIITLIIFYLYSQNSPLKGYWIRPSLLFLLGYLAVNFQYLLDFRLGLKNISSSLIYHPEVLNHCLILGVVGLLAFVAGYIYKPIIEYSCNSEYHYIRNINIPIKLLVILNFVLFIAFLATIDIVSFVTGADFGNSERTHSNFEGLLFVSNALIVLSVCFKTPDDCSLKRYILSFPKISIVIIAVYMIMRLLSGDRGPFIYTALLLFFGYAFSTRKKIKLRSVVIYMLGAMLLVSLVGIARLMDSNKSFTDRMNTSYQIFTNGGRFSERGEQSVMPLTEELGFSFTVNQTDVYAIEEKSAKYNYGTYTITELFTSIPFMPGFMLNTLKIPPEKFSSSGFANYHFFGGYDRTWGIGTSILGDFYLQFGVWGVLLGLFISGMLLKYLDVTLFLTDKSTIGIYTLLLVLLFSSKSIYMPRSSLLVELTNVVWGAIILFAIGSKRLK